jgi:inhibitor of KinA
MRIQPLGDSAIILDFADESSDAAELLRRSLSAADALERANIPGVIEVTSAYQSVALFLDLNRIASVVNGRSIADFLHEKIVSLVRSKGHRSRIKTRSVEIPVCYAPEFAPDLARVSEQTSLEQTDVIELHSSTTYTTACIGFMPGFPFLAGLPAKLHLPRLTTPRTHVPAGSVAIAGAQAGIYPLDSPGGWNIIGRTPLRLFDANANPPALLRPGDRIRFRVISRDEFDKFLS